MSLFSLSFVYPIGSLGRSFFSDQVSDRALTNSRVRVSIYVQWMYRRLRTSPARQYPVIFAASSIGILRLIRSISFPSKARSEPHAAAL
jgi:hypothetical protein